MQEFEPECTLLGNMFQSIVLDLKVIKVFFIFYYF